MKKNESIAAGIRVVKNACLTPFKQIIQNTGASPEIYIEKIKNDSSTLSGFDFRKGTAGNMYEMGIVDPTKVVRCALENAASAAAMLLSAGSSLIETSKS